MQTPPSICFQECRTTTGSVSYTHLDSETGTLTLNDVIPGEASTPINGIKLYENEEKGNYTFSGTNIDVYKRQVFMV